MFDDDDFVLSMNQFQCLTQIATGSSTSSILVAVLFYAPMHLADSFATINVFYRIFDFIYNDALPLPDSLDLGQECRNLLVAQFLRGKLVRIHRVPDSKTPKEILNALALTDFTVIHFLEAEQALVILKAHQSELLHEYKATLSWPSQCHLYITPTISGSALRWPFTHHVSLVYIVPMVVYTSNVPWDKRLKARLLAVMAELREQYLIRLSIFLVSDLANTSKAIQNALVITNLKEVKDSLPLNRPLGSHNPTVHENGAQVNRLLSSQNDSHLVLVVCDVYDKSYMDKFAGDMIAAVLLIVDRGTSAR
ncbi:hypothetical protein EV702DRAFT_1202519 [Suillus placidus]|uniref:Uncharacterized protein n=1 Tax=Suillus placidus TaxID=48579 RepID=A0A9P6ZKP0_9AGAM|nr:hypothetical protein EV702DRAFT_1202519 [Suillus placidus]